MKTSIFTAAIVTMFGTAAIAGDNDSFSGVTGSFGGSVNSFAASGGVSVTGGMGGSGRSFTRNESGSGQFAGASVNWDSSVNKGGGNVIMGAETFTDGFDFSRTINRGGWGFAGAKRNGVASAGGSFGGSFGSFKGEFDDDYNDFPGLGLGHGGFGDGTPGNSNHWDD